MASFTSAIIQGIQQHLAADSTLRALLGATESAPKIMYGGFEGSPLPCVTFIIVSATNEPHFEGDEIWDGEIQVDCWVARRVGIVPLMEIADRASALLNRTAQACTGGVLHTQSLTDPVPEMEEDVWRAMQQFRFSIS